MKSIHKLYSKEWWREYRAQNREKLREYKRVYDRERFKTHGPQENARRKRWHSKNPEKSRAQKLANEAQRQGKLVPQPCAVCGSDRVHKHHPDYSKPLDVIWLCAIHHAAEHRKEALSQQQGTNANDLH